MSAGLVRKEAALFPEISPNRRSVVGILGGMGPAATADFYLKLIQATPAVIDQEHLSGPYMVRSYNS